MNIYEADILKKLYKEPFINQRVLAESAGFSIGVVNKSLRQLAQEGYLNSDMQLTEKACLSVTTPLFWQPVLACAWCPSICLLPRHSLKSTANP